MIWRKESQLIHHASKFIVQNHLLFKTSSYKQLIASLHNPRNKQNNLGKDGVDNTHFA